MRKNKKVWQCFTKPTVIFAQCLHISNHHVAHLKLIQCARPTVCNPVDCSRLLCPWDSPDKNTGVGCHFLLQEIFPSQGSNPGLPHCRGILYHLSHQGSPGYKVTCQTMPHVLQNENLKKGQLGTPLVVQWLIICPPMQGTWVWIPSLGRAPVR